MIETRSASGRLFWACFIALVTCAFGFMARVLNIGEIGATFGWSETQKGIILAVGFWPFALSIFFFSLFIDRFGYGRAALVGFLLHVTSTTILIFAQDFAWFFVGTFLFALSAGTVEAYINPVVATMYSHDKGKWLNILHAGWPGGSVLAGLLVIAIPIVAPTLQPELLKLNLGAVAEDSWRWAFALTYLPTLVYGVMLLGCRFPVSERVAAGVTYREMLRDFGGLGAFIVTYLIVIQIGEILRTFGVFENLGRAQVYLETQDFMLYAIGPALIVGIAFGAFVGSPGKIVFFLLCLVMIPLATTELGVDSWITDLMTPEMKNLGLHAGWILVYTMTIMTVLRFCAGPIIHRLRPIGLLMVCAALAAVGLVFFSQASVFSAILLAATIYGVGKTFFWPTMLAVVSERFPGGGALTINSIAAVGMLGLSVGGVFLGNIQDRSIEQKIVQSDPGLEQYLGPEKTSFLGPYRAIDADKKNEAPEDVQNQITSIQSQAKKQALFTVAIFPVIMFLAYLLLWLYFLSRGGYRAVVLDGKAEKPPDR